MFFSNKTYTSKNADYKKAKRRAANILQDPERLRKLLTSSAKKLNHLRKDKKSKESMSRMVNTLNRMVRAYLNGDYQKIPWKSLLLITSGIVYFVSPLDLIPDFIPVFGFLDDITVLLWIFNAVKGDIEDFEEWESTYARSVK